MRLYASHLSIILIIWDKLEEQFKCENSQTQKQKTRQENQKKEIQGTRGRESENERLLIENDQEKNVDDRSIKV